MQPSGCHSPYHVRNRRVAIAAPQEEPIRKELHLEASPEEVWGALIHDLSSWFGAAAEIDPRPGGAVRFRWPDGTERRGLVETCDPPRRLAFRWRELRGAGVGLVIGDVSTVEFVLEPDAGATRLTVTESPGILASAAP